MIVPASHRCCMMYDTGHGPTFSDTQNRRLRKMEGEGAAQAGLWTDGGSISRHVVGQGRSTATARTFPTTEVDPHHQIESRSEVGRAFFTGPHRPHFSYCNRNVFINVGRKDVSSSDCFPERIIPFATKRVDIVAL